MRSLTTSKPAFALLTGLTLTGALAGCAASTQPATEGTPQTDQSTTPADTGAGTYADGTYTESANYQSPNGTETIDVTITLADDVITDVQVVGHGESPDSKHYQGEFIGGIDAIVVGKDIDSISVSKVAGSSLTSGGFNKAVEAIKLDAAA
ncbi:FMN-binding protein [Leifsonia sp. H3M29-4]|uniref:FMN-binding protein n=1 Tax=Salinibacterium metalliresistens TaxID=3031321 RepID=UPI0023DCEA9F|nr:FMN-binding protein [Salinibacterium metalliresistens]MDF1478292.1 FMN-binding protein [Salinibacterium metalliresistens]